MKTKLLLSVLFLFLSIVGFGRNGMSSLIIQFPEENFGTYIVQMNGYSFSADTSLRIDNLEAGFMPVEVFLLRGRYLKLIYSGGINLAAEATTFADFKRGNLFLTSVVPFYQEIIPQPVFIESMNFAQFNRLKFSVAEESFESNRLQVLTMAARYNYFNVGQIKELMELLSFDSSKLKFGKLAFASVVDPENYYVVSEGLTFSSNKRKLIEFITTSVH